VWVEKEKPPNLREAYCVKGWIDIDEERQNTKIVYMKKHRDERKKSQEAVTAQF
jgi:hypothetical protein